MKHTIIEHSISKKKIKAQVTVTLLAIFVRPAIHGLQSAQGKRRPRHEEEVARGDVVLFRNKLVSVSRAYGTIARLQDGSGTSSR